MTSPRAALRDSTTTAGSPSGAFGVGVRRTRTMKLAALGGMGLMVALSTVALLDARAGQDRVQRNVTLAGRDIGRLPLADLPAVLDDLDAQYRAMSVSVVPPEGSFNLSGADLGLAVNRQRVTASIKQLGHRGGSFNRIGSYVGSFFGSTSIDVPVDVDATAVEAALTAKDTSGAATAAVDPRLAVEGDHFVIKPGKPGKGISAAVIVNTLEQRLPAGPRPLAIPVDRVVLPSRYSDAQIEDLLDRAVQLTANPLPVRVGGKELTLTPKQLRRLVTPEIVGGSVRLTLDRERTLAQILDVVGRVGKPAKDARLSIAADGTVAPVAAEIGQKCCADDSIDRLNAALAEGSGKLVELDLVDVQPKVTSEQLATLGVTELIGTFTTKHAPGEVRVKNIHHISDLLRGIVIQPGETFSVNQTIGPRSAANGFFKAHVIEDGVFAENYGGGISQFATTFFNAAFFAGLDLVEYQSHSLYISRYPFGREATLSYPDPDLKIRNNTPYGILLWPTYTERSITVSLYSTRYVKGEVVDQKTEMKEQCKVVWTTRLRTWVDGRTERDRTRAFYRPAEGKDCKGNPTAGATTTTVKQRDTTTPSKRPDSTADTPDSTRGAVSAGDASETTKSKPDSTKSTKPDATKPESTKPESTKPESTKPKTTKAPEPKPTSPPDNGNVGVGGPPVTGLG